MSERTHIYIPADPDDESSTAAVSPALFVPLRLRSEAGHEIIEIDQPSAVIGRHTDADVRLAAADVSRRHCRVYFDEGTWKVQDLSSLNGLFLNGEPVRVGPLYQGDRLRLGMTTFIVERSAAPRALRGRGIRNETLRSIARVFGQS